MEISHMKYYIVDAFTENVFEGNPAAVYFPEQGWPSDEFMTKLCRENNYSDIALLVKNKGSYDIRWFTKHGEIDFCGHATMAASYVVLFCIEPDAQEVHFNSKHGDIVVTRTDDLINMKFAAYHLERVEITDEMVEATGCDILPEEAWLGRDLMLVYKDEEVVRNMKLNIEEVEKLDGLMFHITAPGKNYDCVSRSFGPKCGIVEDPVCGSGHCHIIPYWSKRLEKPKIKAYQASQRSGVIFGHCEPESITLSGHAVMFARGEAVDEDQ
jgi:PhzF family phenazine biosynthesis protein